MSPGRPWLAILTVFILLIASCAGERPPSAEFQISASSDLNPDANDRPSPIVLKIFALRSADAFNNARFFELYENATNTLGVDLLNQVEFQILPGDQRESVELTFDLEARWLGLLAAYRDLDNSVWRSSVPVEIGETAEFEVILERLTLSTRMRR